MNVLTTPANMGSSIDVLLVNTQQDLSMYKEGEEAKSVTPCCAGKSCRPGYTSSGRKELDYDLNDWICKSSRSTILAIVSGI